LYYYFHQDICIFTAKHPQQWTKHEVGVWLKWCSEEYCIEPIPPDKIDMNGKKTALFRLKKSLCWFYADFRSKF
jgi:hypothetical protein